MSEGTKRRMTMLTSIRMAAATARANFLQDGYVGYQQRREYCGEDQSHRQKMVTQIFSIAVGYGFVVCFAVETSSRMRVTKKMS